MTKTVYGSSPVKRERRTVAEIGALAADAYTIQKAKELKTLALTAAEWAKRKNMGQDAIQYCRSYACEAERKMGQMLAATERNDGGRPSKTGTQRVPVSPPLAAIGVTKKESAKAQALASLPDDAFDAVKSGKKTRKRAEQEAKSRKRDAIRSAAAEAIIDVAKPTYLYYFGDHDPSGVDIPRHIEAQLAEMAPDVTINFTRMAVLPWQIEIWDLPSRPTKKSDSRSHNFEGESVELDAIPASRLRSLVANCIERHIDKEQLEKTRMLEQAERATLQTYMERLGGLTDAPNGRKRRRSAS